MYYINMVFEWDNNKNEYNIANHDGISFEFAIRVFLDEKRIEKKEKNIYGLFQQGKQQRRK